MGCEASWLEVSLEAVNRQFLPYQPSCSVMECEHDQSLALVETEVRKRNSLEAELAEGQSRLDDQTSLVHSSYDMFRYDLNQAQHDCLHPLLDAVGKL